MASKLIHLDMHRDKPLTELTDPCTVCTDKTRCQCEKARVWWGEFAKLYKRQGIINQLGGK